jgi:hypothetical protein
MVAMPFDEKQSGLTFEAYRRFGKGNHPARLNLGDCASYALAGASMRLCRSRATTSRVQMFAACFRRKKALL